MYRNILLAFLLIISLPAIAQNAKLNEARDQLSNNNYRSAMPILDAAILHAETRNSAEVWFLRGMAYLQQATDTTARAPLAASVAYTSFKQSLSLKPDYNPEMKNALYTSALLAFNEGVTTYKSYPGVAYEAFMKVVEIYEINSGKVFAQDNDFTALAGSARLNAAYSAINAEKNKEAIILLKQLKNAPGPKDSMLYQLLAETYNKEHDDAAFLSVVTEARSLFPQNQLFRNLEINYYIVKGQTDILIRKLEQAVSSDPDNAELLFNLANGYERTAYPKDNSGKELPAPANFAELFTKAETAYNKAIKLQPKNADYYYNLGVLYYESAAATTKKMNEIKGMSAPEQKQYDALLAERDEQFSRALPYFESAYAILGKHDDNLTDSEKETYRKAMTGLKEIYSRRNNKAKTDELKAKLDALK